MTYKIVNRYGEIFVVTDKKYDNKTITVNISSIVLTDTITVLKTMPIKEDFVWTLFFNEENSQLYMKLITESMTFQTKMDLDKTIEELVKCVEENKTLSNCIYINEIINKLYNDAFKFFFEDNIVLLSNHIVKDIAYVYNLNNKNIGCASRFIITPTCCYLLEYEGRGKDVEDMKYIEVIIGKKRIQFLKSKIEESFFSIIGYYEVTGILGQICDLDEVKKERINIEEVTPLKVKPNLISLIDMKDYVVSSNNVETLLSYKKTMKPSVSMININKYILKDFMI